MQLEGRVALVTGAGSGIGKAAAIRLAEAGARIAAPSPVPGQLQQLDSEAAPLAVGEPEDCYPQGREALHQGWDCAFDTLNAAEERAVSRSLDEIVVDRGSTSNC